MPDKDDFTPSNPWQARATKFSEPDPRQQVPDVTKVVEYPQVSIGPLAVEPGSTDVQVPPPATVPDKA
jgi:hypothetical protein